MRALSSARLPVNGCAARPDASLVSGSFMLFTPPFR
jgi:hypothetical protein